MKTTTPAQNIRPASAAQSSPLIGGAAAALLAAVMCYPESAWPREHLMLDLSVALFAVLTLTLGWTRAKTASLAGAPAVAAAAAFGLAFWALLRWSLTPYPFAGTEGVAAWCWMAMAMAAGFGAAWSAGAEGFTALRRGMTLAAAGFGAYAFYQYFALYPRNYAMLAAETGPVVTDLHTQSLLHALKERRVGGSLGTPNLYAAQLSIVAVFALSMLRERGALWKALGAAGLALSGAAMLITRSRGGLLTFIFALALGGLYFLCSRQGRSKNTGSGAIGAALAAALLSIQSHAWAMNETLWQRVTNISTIRERLYYWGIAVKVWLEHPLAGGGPGAFELNYMRLKPPGARESQYAHSWFFQSLADLGPLGAGLECLFWAALAWMLWRTLRPAKNEEITSAPARNEAAWLLVALAACCFNGLIEYAHAWRIFRLWIGFLAGGACGLMTLGAAVPSPAQRTPGRLKTLVSAAALLAVFITPVTVKLQMALQAATEAKWRQEGREYPEALEALERAARWQPDNPRYIVSQAPLLMALKRPAEALAKLDAGRRLNPYSASIESQAARIHAALGDSGAALTCLGRAIERYPSSVGYHLQRAALNASLKRPGAAREDLQYIEDNELPIWEYQEPQYAALRAQCRMKPYAPARGR